MANKNGLTIKAVPVKTHDSEGNRFVFDNDPDDNSVWIYDNHKRDGYGIYAGDDSHFSDGPCSISNLKYLCDKLNELYIENQALKNGDAYQQLVLSKIDRLIDEYEFFFVQRMKEYIESDRDEKLKFKRDLYGQFLLDLQYIRNELTGEEYE